MNDPVPRGRTAPQRPMKGRSRHPLPVTDAVAADGERHVLRLRRNRAIHRAVECGSVLGAVNASSLRADRSAASGIDRASAPLMPQQLRGGWSNDAR